MEWCSLRIEKSYKYQFRNIHFMLGDVFKDSFLCIFGL